MRRLALLALVIAAAAPATARAANPIKVVATQQIDNRLVDLTMSTPALASPARVRILVPAGYDAHARKRYPVLYLLQGAFDDYKSWTDEGDAEKLTAGLPLIVVMPEAGIGGWYTNWVNFGAGGPPEWETFHIDQLIPWVDANYRTKARRSGRAIAGLSMGGFGAMSYAGRHPGLFTWAGSFSGAVDTIHSSLVMPIIEAEAVASGSLPGAIFGLRPLADKTWRAHNPWDLAPNLRGMGLMVATGDGEPGPYDKPGGAPLDPIEFGVNDMSEWFHRRLLALGIPHYWFDYGPGTHSWPYWQRDLRLALPRIMALFAHAKR